MTEEFKWSVVEQMPAPKGTGKAMEGIYAPLYTLVQELAKPEVEASPVVRVEWPEKGRAAKAQSSLLSWFSHNLLEWKPDIRTRDNALYIQIARLPEGQARTRNGNGNGAANGKATKYVGLRTEIDALTPGQTLTKKCAPEDARKTQDYAEYWLRFKHADWEYETHLARPTKRDPNSTVYITRRT